MLLFLLIFLLSFMLLLLLFIFLLLFLLLSFKLLLFLKHSSNPSIQQYLSLKYVILANELYCNLSLGIVTNFYNNYFSQVYLNLFNGLSSFIVFILFIKPFTIFLYSLIASSFANNDFFFLFNLLYSFYYSNDRLLDYSLSFCYYSSFFIFS